MRELGPVDEQLVEHRLVDPQDESRLERRDRGRTRGRDQHGQLADRGARTELEHRPISTMHLDASFDDCVKVRLDRALLHEQLSDRQALLDGALSDRGEYAARNAGE